jgi:predicted GH43/DUF377 family glycosyl hydrolase
LVWYKADHNDTLLNIPSDLLCRKLQVLTTIAYQYPYLERYYPTSSSYIWFDGKHLLNTRFVSYYIMDNGCYFYPDGIHEIKNKNILSHLTPNDQDVLMPVSFQWMDDNSVNLPKLTQNPFSIGLEDIRLYVVNGGVRFIATTINYAPAGHIWMVVGDYDVYNCTYSNCSLVVPPDRNSRCEKNWAPVVRKNMETGRDEAWFIYKWSPMLIGRIMDGEQLEIVEQIDTPWPWFDKFRGSTPFVQIEDGFIGLAHFSIEAHPRRYYHSLVLLDLHTLYPKKYSMPFYFKNVGVEFCIGMRFHSDKYTFWFSQMDRDPLMVEVEQSEIILHNI